MYQEIGDALQLRADNELLDVACGSGAFLARQAGHVHRVAGIDLSAIQIAWLAATSARHRRWNRGGRSQ